MTARREPSTDYHDYVFKDGRLIGDFEGMYVHAAETPWHQDRTAFGVTAALDLALLADRRYDRIADVGCGLGHFTARLARELPGRTAPRPSVLGLDVSPTAIRSAKATCPDVDFAVADLLGSDPLPGEGTHELVLLRGVIWYVVHDLDQALARVCRLGVPGARLLVTLPFPPGDRWVGQDVLPTPEALVDLLGRHVAVEHWSVERNVDNGFVPTVHIVGSLRSAGLEIGA